MENKPIFIKRNEYISYAGRKRIFNVDGYIAYGHYVKIERNHDNYTLRSNPKLEYQTRPTKKKKFKKKIKKCKSKSKYTKGDGAEQ